MKTRALCLFLAVLGLSACVPDQSAPTLTLAAPPRATELSFDSQGRVARPRGERDWDDAMGQRAIARLNQADREAFKGVSVRVWDGGVLLTGAVTKPEHRRRAGQLVRSLDGVTQVHDELVLAENPGQAVYVPDGDMEQRLDKGLRGNDGLTGAYVVRVVNGVAYLQGTARAKADVDKAAEFVRGFDGVKWVVDRVSVR